MNLNEKKLVRESLFKHIKAHKHKKSVTTRVASTNCFVAGIVRHFGNNMSSGRDEKA